MHLDISSSKLKTGRLKQVCSSAEALSLEALSQVWKVRVFSWVLGLDRQREKDNEFGLCIYNSQQYIKNSVLRGQTTIINNGL